MIRKPRQRRCFLAGGTFRSRRPLSVSVDGCLTGWSLPHQRRCFLVRGYFRSRRPLSVSGRWFDQLVVAPLTMLLSRRGLLPFALTASVPADGCLTDWSLPSSTMLLSHRRSLSPALTASRHQVVVQPSLILGWCHLVRNVAFPQSPFRLRSLLILSNGSFSTAGPDWSKGPARSNLFVSLLFSSKR